MASDWHMDFFARHIERFPRADWPPPDSGWWDDFRRKLIRHGIREPEATAASESLFDDGPTPAYVSEHPGAIVARAAELRRAAGLAPILGLSPDDTRRAAEDGAWNRRAEDRWASLDEPVRDEWRRLVAERATFLPPEALVARELTAIAWAYDPTSVPDRPTPAETPRSRGVRHLFGQGYDPTLKKV